MSYYARSKNDQGKMETVTHHLKRTGELCAQFLMEIGYEDWGKLLGEMHDVGKFSLAFQMVLKKQKSHVNHALPGAAFLLGAYGKKSANIKLLASVVASHHGKLKSYALYAGEINCSYTGSGRNQDHESREYSLFGKEDYRQAADVWRRSKFIALKRIKAAPSFQDEEDPQLSKMLFERFLFSALVDADWSSSAEHFEPDYLECRTGSKLNPEETLKRLFEVRRRKRQNFTASSSLNYLRDQLFDDCLKAGENEPGLFTLTAPTGLGKTLSLLAFSLRHCACWKKRRIVLILPYLTIIEQNSKDYREILPDLLEIHSNVQYDEGTRLLAERWDVPCIITTNVSFFEPLFSDQPGECRHLHQLANSVIVLDEAQSLPTHLLDATLRTVKLLCDSYGCTVVFSTATQPSFQYRPGLAWEPREIAPNAASLFAATRRVKWEWRVDKTITWTDLAEELVDYKQHCVIVNKKAHARKILNFLLWENEKDEVFYLSTDLCPAHRSVLLEKVRDRLKNGLPCHLVATQCIEAGVDIDFPVVFRALAPLDSLIQAAGRCNRNGDSTDGRMVVFLPEEEDSLYPTPQYGEAAMCVQELMKRHEIDCSNLSHIEEYYQMLYQYGEGDDKKLKEAIELENYQEVKQRYRIIKQDTIQVIVPYSGEKKLYEEVRDRLDQEGLTSKIINMAKPITVSCYDKEKVQQYCEPLYYYSHEDGIKVPTKYYLLGIPDYYTEKQGLYFEEMLDGIF